MRRRSCLLLVVVLVACTPTSASPTTPAPASSAPIASVDAGASVASASTGPVPEYLHRMETLTEHLDRGADRSTFVKTPESDLAALRAYPHYANKGPITGPAGERLTIMTAKSTYSAGEEVRILHVHEATRAGVDVMVMGPKGIYGEYIDGRMVSYLAAAPDEPYDGVVLQSPNVDFNYESSVYKLPVGRHTLQWKFKTLSGTYLESNTLQIEVR